MGDCISASEEVSMITRIIERLQSGVRWPGPLVVSILVLAIAISVSLSSILKLAKSAMFAPSVDASVDPFEGALNEHDEFRSLSRRRIDGRSLFTPPPPPPRKVIAAPPPPPTPPPPPPSVPVVPASYTGTKPSGMLPYGVIFENGSIIRVGAESSGVKVLEIVDAFTVKLAHAGGTYEVRLFSGATLETLSQPWSNARMPSSGGVPIQAEVSQPSGVANPVAPPVEDPATRGEDGEPAGEIGEIPEPLTAEAIDALSRQDSAQALVRIRDANKRTDLDEPTRARLAEEQRALIAHIQAIK